MRVLAVEAGGLFIEVAVGRVAGGGEAGGGGGAAVATGEYDDSGKLGEGHAGGGGGGCGCGWGEHG